MQTSPNGTSNSTAATTPSTTSPSTTSSPAPTALVPGQPLTASATGVCDKRTLFVSGFPTDVKPREVHNFFRFLPGFVSAVLSAKRAVRIARHFCCSVRPDRTGPNRIVSHRADSLCCMFVCVLFDRFQPVAFVTFERASDAASAQTLLVVCVLLRGHHHFCNACPDPHRIGCDAS